MIDRPAPYWDEPVKFVVGRVRKHRLVLVGRLQNGERIGGTFPRNIPPEHSHYWEEEYSAHEHPHD